MKTMTDAEVTLTLADWSRDGADIYAIRHVVFVQEQNVPVELERDEHDAVCHHVLARDAVGKAIATARLLADGHIGRVAVLRERRGHGIGKQLMLYLIELAREQGFTQVELNAQTQALDFYLRLGFEPQGDVFYEAGLAHRSMRLGLRSPPEE